jgi:integrase/recombinase XerD
VTHNPVKGVKRPQVESYEGKTPAIADAQARILLSLPEVETLKGKRDRAILSTLLHHALRREELCALRVKDIHARRGVPHLRVRGKGARRVTSRFIPGRRGLSRITWKRQGTEMRRTGRSTDR